MGSDLMLSIGELLVMMVVAISTTRFINKKFRLPRRDTWIVCWLVFDTLTHFFIVLPFVIISTTGNLKTSENFLMHLWKETGKVDARVLVADPTFLSIEVITLLVDLPLTLFLIYVIILRIGFLRHFTQIALSVCELYALMISFLPELLHGFPNLSMENVPNLLFFIWFNCAWLVIPIALLKQSYISLHRGYSGVPADKRSPSIRPRSSIKQW